MNEDPAVAGEVPPGILETSIVFALSALLTVVIVAFFGGPLSDIVAVVVEAARGSH